MSCHTTFGGEKFHTTRECSLKKKTPKEVVLHDILNRIPRSTTLLTEDGDESEQSHVT